MSDDLNFSTTTAGQPGPDDSSRRRAAIGALLRGRLHWAILLSLVLAGVLGFLGYQSVEPMYKSTGAVIMAPDPIMFGNLADPQGMNRWKSFLFTQEQKLSSKEVADRAMALPAWKVNRGEDAEPWTHQDFSEAISADMDEADKNNNFFTISFEAEDGVTAGAGNQAAIQAYAEEFANDTETQFYARINRLRKVVNGQADQINQALGMRRTVMSDAAYDQMEGQLRGLQQQRLELKFQLDEVRAWLASRNPDTDQPNTNPADLLAADTALSELQAQKEALEGEIQMREFEGKGPDHPMVKRLYNRRDVTVAQIESRIEQLQSDGDVARVGDPEYTNFRRLEQQWHRQLVDVENELDQLSKKRAEVMAYQDQIAAARDLIADAELQIEQLRIELDGVKNIVRISGFGPTPTEPYNLGKAKQMAALGGILGLLGGFGLVMGIGAMDRRLRHVGDARLGLGDETRMLGVLPTLPENFADPDQSERAAHAVHHIRTLLQISNRGTARVFSVTSPAAGSGKSSLTVALGLSFAASESKTLVIDCDLVGAGLTRRVGAVVNRSVEAILREDTVLTDEQISEAVRHAREKGVNLKDALVELGMLTKKDMQRLNRRQADSALGVLDACQGRPFSECVANTGIDNFSVLPIGAAKPQDAGQLSPKSLRMLINRAREEYDVVLIDTGPCLGSLEASMAAAESDATVLIVSRGDSKSMAVKARDHLVSVGANVVGVVFNHALENDLNSSSFASVISQERRTDPAQNLLNADPAVAARFGPLGSAVAAFGRPSKSPNGRPRRSVTLTSGPGVAR